MTDLEKLNALDDAERDALTRLEVGESGALDAFIHMTRAFHLELVNAYRSGDLVPRAVLDEAVGVIKNMEGRLQHADRVIVHAQGTKSPDRTDAVAQAAAFLAKHGGGDAD